MVQAQVTKLCQQPPPSKKKKKEEEEGKKKKKEISVTSVKHITKRHVFYHVLHVCGESTSPLAFEGNRDSSKLRSRG